MIGWIALAYLCGSIPFGLLVARAATGKDVRTVGSGNIGATNVARAAGKPAAIATLLLDAGKGLVPVLLAPHPLAPWCALAAVVGHCFPIWLKL
ncbi:MAG: glycerol-3-phosphate acyltransferase, partial [Myxococcales bacterium]